MKAQIDTTQEQQNTPVHRIQQESSTGGTAMIVDNRPNAVYQRKLHRSIDHRKNDKQKLITPVIQLKRNRMSSGFRSILKENQREEEVRRRQELHIQQLMVLLNVNTAEEVMRLMDDHRIDIGEFLSIATRFEAIDTRAILSLFEEDLSYNEVSAMLQIEPNVDRIKELMEEKNNAPTLGDIQFVSSENGKIGSIYFENGRIRLLHEDGPTVEMHDKDEIERYVIPKKRTDLLDENIYDIYQDIKEFKLKPENLINSEGILLEVLKEGNDLIPHPSRGTPKPFNVKGFEQRHLNILYNIANELSEKIKEFKQATKKIKALEYDLNRTNDEIKEYEGDVTLNPNEKIKLENLKKEKKEYEDAIASSEGIASLDKRKKKAIRETNNLLEKWVNNHPVLKQITLSKNLDSVD